MDIISATKKALELLRGGDKTENNNTIVINFPPNYLQESQELASKESYPFARSLKNKSLSDKNYESDFDTQMELLKNPNSIYKHYRKDASGDNIYK